MRMRRIGSAELWLVDCQYLLTQDINWSRIGAVVTDPPYGIGYRVNERKKRCPDALLKATKETETAKVAPIHGDDMAFDPIPWLHFRKAAFFGAQHFSDRLPLGRWLVWDKRNGSAPDDHSDCDLVWMTGDGREAMRIHRQKWRGVIREGEENCSRSRKLHPNQKPVALIDRILDMLDLPAGATVFDPYMGSGSTAVVALRRGLQFIGCEIDPDHFETACTRIGAQFG